MTYRLLLIFVVALSIRPLAAQENGTQWQVAEWTFASSVKYERPYEDVVLFCTFSGPEGRRIDVEGFHDGGNRWKVRFCPDRAGTWSWRTSCNRPDDALNGKEGTFAVAAASGNGNPLHRHGGILKVSADRRRLTYSDGTPFFWLGDTWWFCPGNKVPIQGSTNPEVASMFRTLIEKRKSQGMNIVHWASLGGFGGNASYVDFMKQKRGGAFDPTYWATYDEYVRTANDAGIVPVIGFGFSTELDGYSVEELEFLWRYVVARYGACSVTWLICGEYNQNQGKREERIEKVLRLGAFIKERDPYKRAMTVHPWYFKEETRDAWKCDWFDFVLWQGAHVGHGNVPPTSTYRDSAELGKPFLEGETQYEGIYGGSAKAVTPDDVQRAAWHAVQSGCCGFTYGANGLWYPTQNADDDTFVKDWGTAMPWWEAMRRPGPERLYVMKTFYERENWFRYRPVPESLLLEGEYRDATRPLLQVDDRGDMILYSPAGNEKSRKIAIKTADGRYGARWFNPRTSEETAAGDLEATDGCLTVPDRPDEFDWVLTLKKPSMIDEAR